VNAMRSVQPDRTIITDKVDCKSAKYNATVKAQIYDVYDFNDPKAITNPVEYVTHLAYTAEKGGTLAVFETFINVETTIKGQL
jgi:hypothetical protein